MEDEAEAIAGAEDDIDDDEVEVAVVEGAGVDAFVVDVDTEPLAALLIAVF